MANLLGQVAEILNERELAINIGAESGVEIGMIFLVRDKPVKIKDPKTGAELGIVSREKVRVKIAEVQPRFAIARTYETYQVNTGGTGAGLASSGFGSTAYGIAALFGEPPRVVTKVKTLSREDRPNDPQPLDPDSSFVKVGDPVEQILDEPKPPTKLSVGTATVVDPTLPPKPAVSLAQRASDSEAE